MNSTKTIIAIDYHRLNSFALLAFNFKIRTFIDGDIHIDKLFDAYELVEAEPLVPYLALIILSDSRSIDDLTLLLSLMTFGVFDLLTFEWRQHE